MATHVTEIYLFDTTDPFCPLTLTHSTFLLLLSSCWYTHAVTDRKYSFWVGFFYPLFFLEPYLEVPKGHWQKKVHESAASIVLSVPDCCSRYLPGVAVWRAGFLFLFHFLCSKLSYMGCCWFFFVTVTCSLEYFFLTTATSLT